jgi:hypothetical protein
LNAAVVIKGAMFSDDQSPYYCAEFFALKAKNAIAFAAENIQWRNPKENLRSSGSTLLFQLFRQKCYNFHGQCYALSATPTFL